MRLDEKKERRQKVSAARAGSTGLRKQVALMSPRACSFHLADVNASTSDSLAMQLACDRLYGHLYRPVMMVGLSAKPAAQVG